MKKILIYGLTKNLGGIENFIYNHLTSMNLEGMEIHLLVYEKPVFYNELLDMGCIFHFIPRRGVDFKKNRSLTKKLFEDYDFNTIWFNVCTLSYILPLKEAYLKGVKNRIIHVHSPNASGGWKMKLFHNLNKKNIKKYANIFLSCSKGASEYSYDRDIIENQDYRIIYNAINVDKFIYNEENRKKIRNELNISEEDFVIGHVGRLSDVKNHNFLIDVFDEINKEVKSKLVLVGEGELRNKLEEKVRELNLDDRVIFLGMRTDIEEILSAFDSFVFPSKYEGLSLSLVEAQASGLRCFLSTNISEENNLTKF